MSEYDWDDFESEDEETEEGGRTDAQPSGVKSLPKHLRQLIVKAAAEKKAALKRADEAEAQLRKNTIEGVLSSRNVPAKVARLIPADVAATPEGVSEWLQEYGDVFGVSAENASQNASQGATGHMPADADNAALARMQNTAATGAQSQGAQTDLQMRLNDPSLTFEQLQALIRGETA
ncbi:hypothetical protein ABZ470_23650 [Streptosporangium sp. NPDC020072]|uniref:hypothetical protein n=1 Tax=Streptosporangium sp. NPDC020072 TaxID=3154788 RepID=UPI00342C28CC